MNDLGLIIKIILVAGIVMVAIRQHVIYKDWEKRRAEEDERERLQQEDRDEERWGFVRFHCPELEADMAEPTVGELKRALAMPQHQVVRARCMDWINTRMAIMEPIQVSSFHCVIAMLRQLEDSHQLPERRYPSNEFQSGIYTGAHRAWLKELVDPQLPLVLPEVGTALAGEGR